MTAWESETYADARARRRAHLKAEARAAELRANVIDVKFEEVKAPEPKQIEDKTDA